MVKRFEKMLKKYAIKKFGTPFISYNAGYISFDKPKVVSPSLRQKLTTFHFVKIAMSRLSKKQDGAILPK